MVIGSLAMMKAKSRTENKSIVSEAYAMEEVVVKENRNDKD